MGNLKLIVVVEDKEEEQKKALDAIKSALCPENEEELWARIIPNSPQVGLKEAKILVLFASDLATALSRVEFLEEVGSTGMTGVITDLMFPKTAGAKEEPNGLGVIVACIHSGVPVVVCSDTDHHDVGYLKTVFPVLSSAHPKGEIPVILDTKDWVAAVSLLLKQFAKPEVIPSTQPPA